MKITKLALLAVLAALVAGLAVGIASAATSKKGVVTKPNIIVVNMNEYKFKFAPKKAALKMAKVVGGKLTLTAGTYTFVSVNRGQIVHNFDIQGVKATKIVPGGKTSIMTVKLKAGKYQYLCDIPRHAELGMAGILIVK